MSTCRTLPLFLFVLATAPTSECRDAHALNSSGDGLVTIEHSSRWDLRLKLRDLFPRRGRDRGKGVRIPDIDKFWTSCDTRADKRLGLVLERMPRTSCPNSSCKICNEQIMCKCGSGNSVWLSYEHYGEVAEPERKSYGSLCTPTGDGKRGNATTLSNVQKSVECWTEGGTVCCVRGDWTWMSIQNQYPTDDDVEALDAAEIKHDLAVRELINTYEYIGSPQVGVTHVVYFNTGPQLLNASNGQVSLDGIEMTVDGTWVPPTSGSSGAILSVLLNGTGLSFQSAFVEDGTSGGVFGNFCPFDEINFYYATSVTRYGTSDNFYMKSSNDNGGWSCEV